MGGWWAGGGLNDNNAILNSVDVVVEVGVELGNIVLCSNYSNKVKIISDFFIFCCKSLIFLLLPSSASASTST